MKKIKILFGALLFLFAIVGCSDFIFGTIEISGGKDDPNEPTYYTVTFNANGGTVSPSSITRQLGTSIILPIPTRNGYNFNGWYSASSGGTYYGGGDDNYAVNANITLYAQWTPIGTNTYTITFDPQGGNLNTIARIEPAGTVIFLPTPTRGSDTFNGWYSSSSGGTRFGGGGDSYTVIGDVTMYAQWTTLSESEFTITFDSQGGSDVSPISAMYGTQITLPTPVRSGYLFNGWFGGISSGVKYGDGGGKHLVIGDVTMYARWSQIVLGGNDTESGKDTTINGIACILVKAGTFTMGENDQNYVWWSGPATQQVTLTKDYWISKYPITQSQYQTVMGNNPSYFSGSNNPVENVTWFNANDFCQAVGGRLPTEAEWEFAARGGNKSQGYIYSGSNNIDDVAWYYANSNYGTKPVGLKLPNELGIYDMSGNVWEWCSDWYSDYSSGAVVDPIGPSSGSYRVLRGGSWYYDEQYCRVAYRNDNYPSDGSNYLGFRVAFPRN
ncbi:MAG: SUMF1/EgtB/PvdO family nonheme iron enzyme [Chitinivibrionia bacterium]|nr:SUMF1/EgtB/PvdO family nonheme iron enzyme [Chitinivibrionia bacterium]